MRNAISKRPFDFLLLKRGVLGLKRRCHEFGVYLRPFINSEPHQKFVIFAQGRTGSWLLYDLLNAHPNIHCDKEILAQKVSFPERYVKGLAVREGQEVYGFHAQVRQLRDVQRVSPGAFLAYLEQEGWQIIYLRRENYLRQSVSSMIAVKRRRWKETTANPLQDFKTHIDCDELLRWLERREINFADEQKALANLPYIELVYEKDLLKAEVHQKTMDRLFAYLGVPAMPVKSKLVRISPNKMPDFIENYAEVANVVSQTKYAKFLYG